MRLYRTPGTRGTEALKLKFERRPRLLWAGVGILLVLTAIIAGRGFAPGRDDVLKRDRAVFANRSLTGAELQRLAAAMDPAMRSLALRHDPGIRQPDL